MYKSSMKDRATGVVALNVAFVIPLFVSCDVFVSHFPACPDIRISKPHPMDR